MSIVEHDDLDDIPARETARYASLGLISNPFVAPEEQDEDAAVASEIAAAGNVLLKAIAERSAEEAPRPLVVLKGDLPSQYALQAMGSAESFLATDEGLGVLYAYVPLFAMRVGAVRATLSVIAERLAFRDFETTLVAYISTVLTAPDESLASFIAAGPEPLAEFATAYSHDARAAVRSVFGDGPLELHPQMSQVADLRHAELDADGIEEDAAPELDASVGTTPGAAAAAAAADELQAEKDRAVFEYLTEYTSVHLSPVVARALRVYRDRGLVAFAGELRVTKAPRKTLTAILKLAATRFKRSAFIYDGFENWLDIPEDTRSSIVGALSELRWKAAGLAYPVFVLSEGDAPEIEETFGGSGSVRWDFPGLLPMQENRGTLLPQVVDEWLACAALAEGTWTMAEPVLAALAAEADGSMRAFIRMAHAAIESAAERGLDRLDDEARQSGLAARP